MFQKKRKNLKNLKNLINPMKKRNPKKRKKMGINNKLKKHKQSHNLLLKSGTKSKSNLNLFKTALNQLKKKRKNEMIEMFIKIYHLTFIQLKQKNAQIFFHLFFIFVQIVYEFKK